MSRTGVMLFTRDLRTHDHPALAAATSECDTVIPLFVLDDRLLNSANRTAFLLESLAELRESLRGRLVVRHGDPVVEVGRFEPDVVYLSQDVSRFARRREDGLRRRFTVRTFPGVTVAVPGTPAPAGATHYQVFTPYWRAWRAQPMRQAAVPKLPVRLPSGIEPGPIPRLTDLVDVAVARNQLRGGEREGLRRLGRALAREKVREPPSDRLLWPEASSQLSPYLHFGCVSPAEAARRADAADDDHFLRQLCWRDFYAQLLAARPDLASRDMHPKLTGWQNDPNGFDAWKAGQTGVPIVDAAMRQLEREGWISNRARLIVAAFLTKHLMIDWQLGARHFMTHLVDGDVASNAGNWQWVAGTGSDPRRGRSFNVIRQGRRFDPSGEYVRRFPPEQFRQGRVLAVQSSTS